MFGEVANLLQSYCVSGKDQKSLFCVCKYAGQPPDNLKDDDLAAYTELSTIWALLKEEGNIAFFSWGQCQQLLKKLTGSSSLSMSALGDRQMPMLSLSSPLWYYMPQFCLHCRHLWQNFSTTRCERHYEDNEKYRSFLFVFLPHVMFSCKSRRWGIKDQAGTYLEAKNLKIPFPVSEVADLSNQICFLTAVDVPLRWRRQVFNALKEGNTSRVCQVALTMNEIMHLWVTSTLMEIQSIAGETYLVCVQRISKVVTSRSHCRGWHAGTQTHRPSGTQESRHRGTKTHRGTKAQRHRGTEAQMRRSTEAHRPTGP